MHMVHIGCSLGYISELVSATSALPGQSRLRSSGRNRYEIPVIQHKIGERAFSYAGSVAWNSLPTTLTNLTDTHTFKSSLITYLSKFVYKTYDFYMYSTFGHRVVMSCTLLSGCRWRYRNALIIIIIIK